MEQPRITVRPMKRKQGDKKPVLKVQSRQSPQKRVREREKGSHKEPRESKKETFIPQSEQTKPEGVELTKFFSLLSSEKEIDWRFPSTFFSNQRIGRKERRQLPFSKLMLSLGGAILLGTVMGISMISLFFSDEPPSSTRSIDSHLQSSPPSIEKKEGGTEKKKEGSISLPKLKGVLLQGGSYKEKKGALSTVEAYRVHGWAAVMDEKPPHSIYLGIAGDQEGAKKLADQYKNEGVGVYLKEFVVEGTTLSSGDKQETTQEKVLPQFVESGHQIFSMMTDQTSVNSSSATFAPDWEKLTKSHRQFVSVAGDVNESVPKDARPHLLQMMQAIDQVVQSSDEARKNWNDALLWQIQEGLIRYALAYEKFGQALQE